MVDRQTNENEERKKTQRRNNNASYKAYTPSAVTIRRSKCLHTNMKTVNSKFSIIVWLFFLSPLVIVAGSCVFVDSFWWALVSSFGIHQYVCNTSWTFILSKWLKRVHYIACLCYIYDSVHIFFVVDRCWFGFLFALSLSVSPFKLFIFFLVIHCCSLKCMLRLQTATEFAFLFGVNFFLSLSLVDAQAQCV